MKAWAENGLTCAIKPGNWLTSIRSLFLIFPVFILAPSSLGAMLPGFSENPAFSTWALGEIRVHDLSAEGEDRRVVKVPGRTTARGSEIEALISGILREYRDNAYLLSRMQDLSMDIDSLTRKVDLDIYVSGGPRCYISKISLQGNRSIPDELFSRVTGLMVGVALPERTLQAGLETVVEWYRDHGYPYAELKVEHFSIDAGGGVELEVLFEEGKRVRVGNITVEGNRMTRENVVLLQFGIKPGDSFSMMEIEKGRERLIASDLYSAVDEINLIRSDNSYKVDLEVVVEEEKPNSFGGAMGLVPGIGGRVRPTGTMNLVLGNLWGTGRKTTVKWMGRGEGISQLDLYYLEPWIGGSQVSGELRFTQELRDTSFSRLELAFAGTGPISRRYGVRLGVEHQSIYSVIGTQTGGERNSRLSLLTGVYRSTTSGSRVSRMWGMDLEFLIGRRKIDGVSFGELEGKGRLLTTLWSGRGKDLRLNIGGRFIDSPIRPVPDYQLFSLGGSETIRGYAEDRIWGNRAIWERIEFGFGVDGDSRYLLFYDLGVVDTADDGRSGALLQGFGTGVRVASKIGVMKIDYALRRGLEPLEGRLHVGWSQDF
jgi:outer membrane protein insertion porin family